MRAQWNRVLLEDVVPSNHCRLVLAARGQCAPAEYYALFPAHVPGGPLPASGPQATGRPNRGD